jgi:hypothetical protein
MKTAPRELIFDSPLDFRMDLEATEDGERIIRERDEHMADKRRNEQAQEKFDL